MRDLGDRKEDSIIYFHWSANDKQGAAVNRTTNGTISVYKGDNTTQSTAGITDTANFNSVTGLNMCKIDTSADVFYAIGNDYSVVLSGAVIDGESVNSVLATFSIENRTANQLGPQAKLDVNAEVDSALNTAIPGSPTAGSVNDVLKDVDTKLPTNNFMGSGDKDNHDTDIDSILADTAEMQPKLPTNNIMGSSVKTDKDDEIDSIKSTVEGLNDISYSDAQSACDAAITANTDINNIDTGVNNIESKLPSKSYLTGSDNSDGDIQLDEATGALPVGAFANHPDVGLKDDCITSAKFDESTAYPLKSSDTGSTSVARVGADGDTLESLSDQVDGVQNSVDGIQNNTRFVGIVPTNMLVPDAGSKMYKLIANFYDTDGNMEDPDNNEIDVLYEGVDGTDKDAFFDDAAGTTPATSGTIDANMWKMVKISTGVYETYYKLPSTEVSEQWMASFKLEESSVLLRYMRTTNVVEENPGSTTLADNITNKDIIAEALKERDVSGVSAVSGSIYKDTIDKIDIIDTNVDFILVDTNETQGKLPTNNIMGSGDKNDHDADIDSIKSRVETGIPNVAPGGNGGIPTVNASNYIAGIQGTKNKLDDLNDVSTSEVNAECDTALSDYDGPTKTEMDSAFSALNDISPAEVNGEVDTALSDIKLDHLMAVADSDDVVNDSVIAKMSSKGTPADWSSFNNTTDALEAIADSIGGGGLTQQQVRDAMKLAPTGGAPVAGSIDEHLDDILADTNEIQGKLPTNNIMGSGDKDNHDTDIDAILVDTNETQLKLPTNNIMGSGVKSDKDDEVDATVLALATYLDATVSSRAVPGDLMNLANDAITSAKFDESTAYPLKSTDSGSTSIARTGADGDTLETLSDQVDGVQSSVDSIQNNTRFVGVIPSTMVIPESDYNVYKILANFYDEEGDMKDPDDNEIAVVFKDVSGTSKTQFYDDSAVTTPSAESTTFPGEYKMVRVSKGIYEIYYKLENTETIGQWVADFSLVEDSNTLDYKRTSNVVDQLKDTVELSDTDENKQIIAKSLKDQDVSAISSVEGSIADYIPDAVFAEEVDGIPFSQVGELVMAMVDGRIRKDDPEEGYLTFYKRNNSTVLTTTRTTENERTRQDLI